MATLVYTVAGSDGRIDRIVDDVAAEQMVCRLPEPPWSFTAWSEKWFPDSYRRTAAPRKGGYTDEAAFAVARCRECPFIVSCGQGAMRAEGDRTKSDRHGIYGGMDPQDRYERMIASHGGTRPRHPSFHTPIEDAAPLRALLEAERRRYPSATAMDVAVGEAVGLSSDTIRMIRKGQRPEVRQTTGNAIRGYFERGGK